jgi:hypothetical protein
VAKLKRQTIIDLTRYAAQGPTKMNCSPCRKRLILLAPRTEILIAEPKNKDPMYYLCTGCGRIMQVGQSEEICGPEDRDS